MDKSTKNVIYLILVVFIIFLITRRSNKKNEGFRPAEQCGEKYFSPYMEHIPYPADGDLDATADIKDDLIDIKACHPSCCTKQWPVPFDNLDSNQLTQCIANTNRKGNTFVSNPYRCSYGATGCPCIDTKAYLNLASRGGNNGQGKLSRIPKNWLISDKKVASFDDDNFKYPYEKINSTKSSYQVDRNTTDNRNDIGAPVKDVMGWSSSQGTSISAPSQTQQLAQILE